MPDNTIHPESTLLVRTDASAEIGLGHAMRCVALAQEWQRRGGRVVFAMRDTTATMDQRLHEEGFERITIDTGPEAIMRMVSGLNPSWVALDLGTQISDHINCLQDVPTLVIDDLGADFEIAPTLILNQNAHASATPYRGVSDDACLLGVEFVLLRNEFLTARTKRAVPMRCDDVVLVMGGTDPMRLLPVLAKEIISVVDVNLHLIAGGPALRRELEGLEPTTGRLVVHTDPRALSGLMSKMDLAVSSGGTTVWELAYMGVPSLVGAVSAFEVRLVEGLESIGLFEVLGQFDDLSPQFVASAVRRACTDHDWRTLMSNKARTMIDGRGRERIVTTMLNRTQ